MTKMHKAALAELQQNSETGNSTLGSQAIIQKAQPETAALSFAMHFMMEDSESEDNTEEPDLFEGITGPGNEFYDNEGNMIMFSVGDTADKDSDDERLREMDKLIHYDHSFLAEAISDEPEDVTVSRSAAALDMLGMFLSSCPRIWNDKTDVQYQAAMTKMRNVIMRA